MSLLRETTIVILKKVTVFVIIASSCLILQRLSKHLISPLYGLSISVYLVGLLALFWGRLLDPFTIFFSGIYFDAINGLPLGLSSTLLLSSIIWSRWIRHRLKYSSILCFIVSQALPTLSICVILYLCSVFGVLYVGSLVPFLFSTLLVFIGFYGMIAIFRRTTNA